MPDQGKVAFVAMKFAKDPWNDPAYTVISEVLRESGYRVIRGDEVQSSGAVVDEVLMLLRTADCVVFDTTGDSSNVAYELGFCHGVGRQDKSLILLRRKGDPLPFNYQHYRHHLYGDLKHLRRVLRYRLSVSTPLTDDQLGYVFTMELPDRSIGFYGPDVVDSMLVALRDCNFTGRCEYYAVDHFTQPRLYSVGLGLKLEGRAKLNGAYWKRISESFARELSKRNKDLAFQPSLSELAEMRAFRQTFIACGVAEFSEGKPTRLLNAEEVDSAFGGAILERLGYYE
ncbi:hypothetical protein AB0K14_16635 [Actinosynnema sp. NPDC050801]|uniref:hypothetical protein n=1 Tax=unclassified Actinosynnema TaxID=2637065 RepID=UPI003403E5B3